MEKNKSTISTEENPEAKPFNPDYLFDCMLAKMLFTEGLITEEIYYQVCKKLREFHKE